jgi:hypothetical protein
MNIKEAIESCFETGAWARPCDWEGYGQAITYTTRQGLIVVPSARGGEAWHPHYKDLIVDWEIVDANNVCDEYQNQ